MKTKLTLALMALITSSAFAGIPKVLPEFKNAQQLAEWREEMAAKSNAVPSTSDVRCSTLDVPSAFYTGKPYVESTGSYAFKYRSYNPELARWTSEDPSGFPDGANNRLYVNNSCNSYFDPDGKQRYSYEYYYLELKEDQNWSTIHTYISANNITGTAPGPLNQAIESMYQEFKNIVNLQYPVGLAETPGQRYDYALDGGSGALIDDWKKVTIVNFSQIDVQGSGSQPYVTFVANIYSARYYIYE